MWIREEMEEVMLSKTNSVAQDDEIAMYSAQSSSGAVAEEGLRR
jgi:hypothetical protein